MIAGAFKGTSDPFAVVTKLSTKPGDKPVVLGKTEVYVRSFRVWCLVFVQYCNYEYSVSHQPAKHFSF